MTLDRREIPDREGYLADETGQIWSCYRRGGGVARGPIYSPVKLDANWTGYPNSKSGRYLSVSTVSGGKKRSDSVHVLVCLAFHGERPFPKAEVAHRDGDNANNRADNLRWATREENRADEVLHGTARRGTKHPLCKLTEAKVRRIRASSRSNNRVLAARYGVSASQIYSIKTRRSWKWLE